MGQVMDTFVKSCAGYCVVHTHTQKKRPASFLMYRIPRGGLAAPARRTGQPAEAESGDAHRAGGRCFYMTGLQT